MRPQRKFPNGSFVSQSIYHGDLIKSLSFAAAEEMFVDKRNLFKTIKAFDENSFSKS